ncbi:MAG: hypothetical protein U0324_09655 [Polyangiales bacterium]
MQNETPREKAGSIVLALFVVLPALVVSGFMPKVNVLPLWGWLAITAAGGAVGGGLLGERATAAGAVGGLISGALTPFCVAYYTRLRAGLGHTYFTIEFLIPALVAAIPGFAIYKLAERRAAPPPGDAP